MATDMISRRDPLSGEADGRSAGRLQGGARLALVGVLVALGLWTIKEFLPALAWAAVLAIAIWPLYEKAERRWPPGKHNVLLPGVFAFGVLLLFGIPLVFLLVQAAHEVRQVMELYRTATTSGIPVPDWVGHLPFGSEAVTRWWQDNLAGGLQPNAIAQRVNRSQVVALSRTIGGQVAHRAVLFFFALMTLFFLLKEHRDVYRQLLEASQRLFGARGERVARQMAASVHGTVDGLIFVGLGEGLLMGIVYAVAGVPHATLLGAVTAVAAMVPFAVTVVFAGVGLVLIAQGSIAWAIGVVAIGTVVAFVADHFIRPVLIGGTTRLPFLWVLLGILGGVETWGLLGLFLGPALMSALVLLWREFTDRAAPAPQRASAAE